MLLIYSQKYKGHNKEINHMSHLRHVQENKQTNEHRTFVPLKVRHYTREGISFYLAYLPLTHCSPT